MTATGAAPAPNHHAHYTGCSGAGGLVAGLTMTVGRTGDARLAVQLTGAGAGDHVVDVGCGPGTAARFASRLGARVTGVDPAPVMLGLARRLTRRSARVTYLEGTAESLPLPDGSATVLWSIASVHHWRDLTAGLSEVRRVLAPGGWFLAMERHTAGRDRAREPRVDRRAGCGVRRRVPRPGLRRRTAGAPHGRSATAPGGDRHVRIAAVTPVRG